MIKSFIYLLLISNTVSTGNIMILCETTGNLHVFDSVFLPILTPLSFISIHAALQMEK